MPSTVSLPGQAVPVIKEKKELERKQRCFEEWDWSQKKFPVYFIYVFFFIEHF
jgi:hypothetical protein